MLAVLFTETGQMPVCIRRLLLALGRLKYMLGVDPGRVVHSALLDSIALCRDGKAGWASDLLIMLRRLPTSITLGADDLLCSATIDAVRKEVITIVDADLQGDIDRLVKTHLLRNRVEMGQDKSLGLVSRRLRHYLTAVVVPAHRKAMTGLLLGDHNLSVERLRYGTRYRKPVPRKFRLCRFCRGAVEDEVHALFDCVTEPRLIELRANFLGSLATRDPGLRALYGSIPNYEFLLQVISSRKAVQIFAKHIYLVLCVFQDTPRYFPLAFRNTV
ncbi:hypothetical protein B0H14DRAFT_3530891 [Mycena olivaceomarginata]|nr:hypothetical protein B0H14DRAFT_3530891 [Mycena olivaceomarginata]